MRQQERRCDLSVDGSKVLRALCERLLLLTSSMLVGGRTSLIHHRLSGTLSKFPTQILLTLLAPLFVLSLPEARQLHNSCPRSHSFSWTAAGKEAAMELSFSLGGRAREDSRGIVVLP